MVFQTIGQRRKMYEHYKQFPPKVCVLLKELFNTRERVWMFQASQERKMHISPRVLTVLPRQQEAVLGIPAIVAKSGRTRGGWKGRREGRDREARPQQPTHPRQLQLVSRVNIPLARQQWQSGKGAAKATQSWKERQQQPIEGQGS